MKIEMFQCSFLKEALGDQDAYNFVTVRLLFKFADSCFRIRALGFTVKG